MTSDTRPTHPVTPVTTNPSRRHAHRDGRGRAVTCANGSCDGRDGFRPTPSQPLHTALAAPCGRPATRPVTPGTGTPSYGSLVEHLASALASGETPARTAGVGLPLAPLPTTTSTPSLYYAVTPIDARGRLADRSPIRALGWPPGQPITITVTQQAIIVTAQAGGTESITRQGHLRLPARIRHSCHLNTGDRLLVATAPPGVLVAYTTALLESMLLLHHTAASSNQASI